jgi:predicted dinucleotide-binding enzyme
VSRHEAIDLRLDIVGAGKIGTAIARAAVAGDDDVAISGSGAVERIELIVEVLARGVHLGATDDVVHHAELIVLAVPMHRFRDLPGDLFDAEIVADATNYWAEIDGINEDLATAPSSGGPGTSTTAACGGALGSRTGPHRVGGRRSRSSRDATAARGLFGSALGGAPHDETVQ